MSERSSTIVETRPANPATAETRVLRGKMSNPENISEEFLASLQPLSQLIVDKMLERMGGSVPDLPDERQRDRGEVLALDEAAAELQHSYYWLSRNYRKLGLRPSRVGGKLLFMRRDIAALLVRQQVRYRGRPRAAARPISMRPMGGTY